ncbi:MAG: hypothetical protein K940chlam8_00512 [Chlamydiae bacterium]|nr:hypothetical protein [Chlamydiota bacterium]
METIAQLPTMWRIGPFCTIINKNYLKKGFGQLDQSKGYIITGILHNAAQFLGSWHFGKDIIERAKVVDESKCKPEFFEVKRSCWQARVWNLVFFLGCGELAHLKYNKTLCTLVSTLLIAKLTSNYFISKDLQTYRKNFEASEGSKS